jgi:hypothetical protein
LNPSNAGINTPRGRSLAVNELARLRPCTRPKANAISQRRAAKNGWALLSAAMTIEAATPEVMRLRAV